MSKSKRANCNELIITLTKDKFSCGGFVNGIGMDFEHCIDKLTRLYWNERTLCNWCLFDLLMTSDSPKLDGFFKSVLLGFGLKSTNNSFTDVALVQHAIQWLNKHGTGQTKQELVISMLPNLKHENENIRWVALQVVSTFGDSSLKWAASQFSDDVVSSAESREMAEQTILMYMNTFKS